MTKRAFPPIQSERVRLRLLEESDLPLTLAWRNQDHVRRWFFNPELITAEQHRAWFGTYVQRDDDYVFIIEQVQPALRAVGQVALYRIEWQAGRAELGRLMIGESQAAGKGLAREAMRLLVHEALGGLGLHEVYLEVYDDNLPALAIYAACGFRTTARRGKVLTMIKRNDEACAASVES